LGTFIFGGLAATGSSFALSETLVGVIGVAIVALVYDALFVLIGRFTTSRGIRG
jgi:osmoprotectant transport system permease protein